MENERNTSKEKRKRNKGFPYKKKTKKEKWRAWILIILLVSMAGAIVGLALNRAKTESKTLNPFSKQGVSSYAGEELEDRTFEYTPSTDKTCNNGTCTLTLYSGIKNVYEDERWKDVKDARSLRGSGVECIVKSDGVHIAKCLDWNMTSIKLDLSLSSVSISNEEVPIKIYETTWDEKLEEDVLVLKSESTEIFSLSSNEKEKDILDFEYGDVIHFGENSTEIILQDADTENLEDTIVDLTTATLVRGNLDTIWMSYNTTDGRHALMKFNITNLVHGDSIIDSAYLHTYYHIESLDSGEALNGSVQHVNNQSWNEHIIIRGNEFGVNVNSTVLSSFIIDDGDSARWLIQNVLGGFLVDYTKRNKNCSFIFNMSVHSGSPVYYDMAQIRSKEHTTVGERPFLNITYTEPLAFPDYDYDIYEDFEDITLETGLSVVDTGSFLTNSSDTQYYRGFGAMEVNLNGKNAASYVTYSPSEDDVSIGFWYRTGSYANWASGPNIVKFWSNSLGNLLRMLDEKSAVDNNRQLRVLEGGTVDVKDSTWYWITIQFNRDSTVYWRVYNTSHDLVGTEQSYTGADYAVDEVRIGATGTTAWSGVKIYFDEYVIDKTDATFPLLGWGSGGADTCTYDVGNWDIDCSDNCVWDSNVTIDSNITITGSGILTLNKNFIMSGDGQYIYISPTCEFRINSGGGIV